MLQNILSYALIVVPVLLGFNLILSGLGQILHAFHASNAENFVGKIAGFLKRIVDFLSANVAH